MSIFGTSDCLFITSVQYTTATSAPIIHSILLVVVPFFFGGGDKKKSPILREGGGDCNIRLLLYFLINFQHWYINNGFFTDSMYCLGLPHTRHLTSITMVSYMGVYCNSRTMEEFCLFGSLMPDLKFLTIDAHISHPKSMTLNLAMMPALEELFIAPHSNIHIYDGDVSKILDRVNAPIRFPGGALPDVTHLVASHAKDTFRWIGDRDYNITVLLRHAPRLQQLDMRGVRMEHLCFVWNREDAEEKARIHDHVRNIGTVAFNSDIDEEHDWWTEFNWWVKHSLFCPPRIRKGNCSFQWRTHDVPDIHG